MILDTNAISAVAGGNARVARIVAGATTVALPVVAIGEFRYGIAQSRHKTLYRRWLDSLILDSTVLDVTEQTSIHYAAIQVELRRTGKPIPSNDLWIAALCRQHRLPVLSQDRHFDAVPGIERLGW